MKHPLATPLFVFEILVVGSLNSAIIWLAGGKVQGFVVTWIIYSVLSIRHAKQVQILCEEYEIMLERKWEADSGTKDDLSFDNLVLGYVFPMMMGILSFWSSGILDTLKYTLAHLWILRTN